MWYNGIMESKEREIDPLSVDELIRQGRAQQKKWKKPSNEPPHTKAKPWQEIMDDRLYRGH